MSKTLGFKGWLAENRVSQKEIAELLGISQQATWQKVNGRLDFTLPQISKICAKYHISADIFLPKELQNSNKGSEL